MGECAQVVGKCVYLRTGRRKGTGTTGHPERDVFVILNAAVGGVKDLEHHNDSRPPGFPQQILHFVQNDREEVLHQILRFVQNDREKSFRMTIDKGGRKSISAAFVSISFTESLSVVVCRIIISCRILGNVVVRKIIPVSG